MIVQEMIKHLEEIEENIADLEKYKIGFAKRLPNDEIEFDFVEAISWDDDNELFLIPEGGAQYFGLAASEYTVQKFREFFVKNMNFLNYGAFAKAKIKITSEGGTISQNAPLIGTGWLPSLKAVYFYYEE